MKSVLKSVFGAAVCKASRRHIASGLGLLVFQFFCPPLMAVEQNAPGPAPVFKVYLQKTGVYRLTFEELLEAGLEAEVDSNHLALSQQGDDVPIWVEDGGDGQLGPGDHIEFIGEHLSGHRSYYNEHTAINVYRLELGRSGTRMSSPAPPEDASPWPKSLPSLAVEEHTESDFFLMRFDGRLPDAPEPWYWKRLTHIDPEPFAHGFWLDRYQPHPELPMSLKVHLHGWSTAGGELPDHRADVYLNGELVGFGEWDGEEAKLIEIPEVPAKLARNGSNQLEIRIPKRRPEDGADPVIDEVVLNWIEIRHPRQAVIDGPVRFLLPEDSEDPVRLATASGSRLVAYAPDGSRYDRANMVVSASRGTTRYALTRPAADRLFAVPSGKLLAPLTIEREQPSDLKDPARQADYIIIAHPRLEQAIEPLAEFHRQRGLEVVVVPVPEVYDQFSHSIVDPQGIRDFLSHAYHHWQRPAPRFVLLVGDASWAGRSSGASYGLGDRLPGKAKSRRNLIPAGIHEGIDGLAASDSFYVAVDGDDTLPDMAIGRFTVVEPEEVAAIVDKTLNYARVAKVGPWRRSIAWIASDIPSFRRHSDRIAESIADQGFVAEKVYPRPHKTKAEAKHQKLVREAFDQGQLLVHFHGHGGRFIWRTGIATYMGSGDLFTLDHLDELAPSVNLPVVLSMTCHSAPFDHPKEDSIGEKFLRLQGRGAVAFFGASWRVSPYPRFSRALVDELMVQPTIGEAIQHAKHRFPDVPGLLAKYNLLGDPAIELALPEHSLTIEAQATGKNGWQVSTAMPDDLREGRAVVDWLDEAGEVIYSESLELEGGGLETQLRQAPILGAIAGVRIYVWHEEAGIDGMGALKLLAESG